MASYGELFTYLWEMLSDDEGLLESPVNTGAASIGN